MNYVLYYLKLIHKNLNTFALYLFLGNVTFIGNFNYFCIIYISIFIPKYSFLILNFLYFNIEFILQL